MRTLIVDSTVSPEHAVPQGNPEHAGRYEAVRAALQSVDNVAWTDSAPATDEQILRFHSRHHFDRLADAAAIASDAQPVALDWDTHVHGHTDAAARHAAGAAILAVDAVMAGRQDAAFCLARPPGHHAEPDRAMGFCYYNSVALAALHALDHHGLERVAIIDIDVHHGNGTQCLAERDERVLFASLHQSPLYPGTGHASETGLNGNVVNLPLADGVAGPAWRTAFKAEVLPALMRFQPEFIFVSAGFDAHAADPLGGLGLLEADFAWAAQQLAEFAVKSASARLVSVLEGGYDCAALGRSSAAFVGALRDT
jgi:acetoin utilization deacetylase AcuC-like enzyme